MELIPAIDIRGGRCVRLEQGDYDRETVFGDDPAAMARRWQEAGARRLHVVDLDGAREGQPVNGEAVRAILAVATVPVQLGGGIRDLATIQRYLDAGAERVIMGTTAVKDQTTLLNAVALFRQRVVVGVDARDGQVATEGWLETSEVLAGELIAELSGMGVSRVIYTDISRDATLSGPNLGAIGELAAAASALPSPVAVIVAGGIGSLAHIRSLAALPIEGVIVGKALYTGAIDLGEAVAAIASLSER